MISKCYLCRVVMSAAKLSQTREVSERIRDGLGDGSMAVVSGDVVEVIAECEVENAQRVLARAAAGAGAGETFVIVQVLDIT